MNFDGVRRGTSTHNRVLSSKQQKLTLTDFSIKSKIIKRASIIFHRIKGKSWKTGRNERSEAISNQPTTQIIPPNQSSDDTAAMTSDTALSGSCMLFPWPLESCHACCCSLFATRMDSLWPLLFYVISSWFKVWGEYIWLEDTCPCLPAKEAGEKSHIVFFASVLGSCRHHWPGTLAS